MQLSQTVQKQPNRQHQESPAIRYEANAEIYAQGDQVRRLYRLVEGCVRTIRLSSDGRRQVGDFYYPGEVFGLEAASEHHYSAEALTDCVVTRVAPVAAGDAEHSALVAEITRQELRKAGEHIMLLGRKSAREKVGSFLMAHASRNPNADLELLMGRQDIADYLGLTIETVSRMLTQLRGEAVIEFPAVRRVHVKRWDVLQGLAA